MANLDQITGLKKTDLLMLAALVLALVASTLPAVMSGSFSGASETASATALPGTNSPDAINTRAAGEASNILPGTLSESRSHTSSLPDFSAIRDVRTKKQKFFAYMLPKVRQANDKVRADRRLLLQIEQDLSNGVQPGHDDLVFVATLKRQYRVNRSSSLRATLNELLIRVDVVPESLVLAQAANESGWGTSRFAREANNLFGVWCFRQGCGLTPMDRDEGLNHEVAKYNSVQESISAYIHTINTNPAYIVLRDIRAIHRSDEQRFSGLAFAEGLKRYSSRGLDYVREIQQLIRVNNLQQYTLPIQA